jgi:tetratricopeptide (TPR) repeat protein
MIVKDEAGMLPEFLARARGLWDELVVVDTGSQDDTVAILEAAGAKVLHRPWQNDFALARNYSLEAASGEWILVLDPDEHISSGFVTQVRALLSDTRAGAATVAMQNRLEDGRLQEEHLLRLFRRYPDVRFQHAIHEDLADTLMLRLEYEGKILVHLDAPITHLGYERARATARGKKERDISLIEGVLARDPDDLYLNYKLLEQSRFWSDESLAARVAPAAIAALDRAPDSALGHWAGELVVLAVDGMSAGRHQDALHSLERLRRRLPNSPAIACRMGEILEALGHFEAAAAAFEGAMKAHGPLVNKKLGTIRPHMGLVRLAIAIQDVSSAMALMQVAFEMDANDPEVAFAASILNIKNNEIEPLLRK